MIPWSTDAREAVKDLSALTPDAIEETLDIQRFLRHGRYSIVVATKGFGKSLLLLAKRKNLSGVHHVVPHNLLLDVPELNVETLSRDAQSILYDADSFLKLWGIVLLIVAVRATSPADLPLEPHGASEALLELLSDPSCRTVAGTLNRILHRNRREFARLCDDYGNILVPLAQDISVPVAIFIDNVDECFRDHREIWYISQATLLESAYRTMRISPRIRLYIALRKEAYLKHLPETEMGLQHEGVCLMLAYSKSELQDIFERNICADVSEVLVQPSAVRTDPIQAFLGTTRFPHGYVIEDEGAFDYIHRHTLRRPRDLMEIGAALARIPVADRRPDTPSGFNAIKTAINEAGSRICDSYLQEVMPHLDITMEDCNRMCAQIESNILSADQAKRLCMNFNGGKAECLTKDCVSCATGKHVFCDFHKAGLLGIVTNDPATGAFVQKFPAVGEKLFAETPILPDSDFYLIHPVLDDRIRRGNARYRRHIDPVNIVGYDRTWRHSRVPPSSAVQRPTVFVSSTMDLKNFRDIAEEVVDEERFAVERSEYENSPESLHRMKQLASNCHLFIAILGPRYGDRVEGKSVCEHEFEAAFADKPEKILVYALDVPSRPWAAQQTALLDRIQSLDALRYARGERITAHNFKQRLRKDILERTALLMRDAEQSPPTYPEGRADAPSGSAEA